MADSLTEAVCVNLKEFGYEPPKWEPYRPCLTPGQVSSVEDIVRKHGQCSRVKYDRDTGYLHVYYHFKLSLEGKVALESDVI